MIKKMMSLSLMLALLFCPAWAAEDAAMTVNGVPVARQEAVYYVLSARSKYADIAAYYEDAIGVDYWALTYTSGLTMEQMIKSDVFKEMVMMNVFYAMALELDLSLTEEQVNACDADARSFYDALSVKDAQTYGISVGDINTILRKQALADSVYSLLLNQTDVDIDAVASAVKPEDYVKYDIEYLFRQNPDYDSLEGIEPPDCGTVIASLRAARDLAADASLAAGLNESNECGIVYGLIGVVAGDESISPELISAIRTLAPGDTTDVIETDIGYFVLRLLDNTSMDAYESAVDEAIYQARIEAFAETYMDLFNEAEYVFDIPFWDSLTIGG